MSAAKNWNKKKRKWCGDNNATKPNGSYINLKRSTVFNGAAADIRRRDMCCLHDINTNSCVPVASHQCAVIEPDAKCKHNQFAWPWSMNKLWAPSTVDNWYETESTAHISTRKTHTHLSRQDTVARGALFSAVDALISWDARSVRRKIKWF